MKNMVDTADIWTAEHLKIILDRTPIGISLCDAGGCIKYVNGRFLQIQGYSDPDQILGKSMFELPNLAKVSAQMQDSLKSGKEFKAETLSYGKKNGENGCFALRCYLLKNEDQILGILGYAQDTTEKTIANQELENKTKQFEIINELSRSLGSTLKLEEVLKIIMVAITAGEGLAFNRTFLLLLNQDETYLEGKMAMGPANQDEAVRIWSYLLETKPSFHQLLQNYQQNTENHDSCVNHLVKKIKVSMRDKESLLVRAMENRTPQIIDCSSQESQSNRFLCELLASASFVVVPLISKEKPIGVILADNLISGRPIEAKRVEFLKLLAYHISSAIENAKLYETLAYQVEELKKTNQRLKENSDRLVRVEKLSVMGEITSQVAHEIRNPITIIGGFANSILNKLDHCDVNYEYLKIISQEIQRVENILNNVLNFTRPERARWEASSLNDIVNQTLDMLEKEIEENKISVGRDLSGELPLIWINPDQIRHALVNILRNAIVAMPKGGVIQVKTHQSDGSAKLNISDTGTGIPKENLGNIFKAFYTTKPDNNGLGLTVAWEIIKNHNGSIGVESEEGKGTTFCVELPLKKEE